VCMEDDVTFQPIRKGAVFTDRIILW
jgi:hypothetical protein